MRKRKKYPAELKAKIALEALRGEHTMAELSARYNVHPNLIANWKKKAQASMVDVFSEKRERQDASREVEIQQLRAKIRELVIEKDFLVEGLRSLSSARTRTMIDSEHTKLSIVKQCQLLSICRSTFYYVSRGESELNMKSMRLLDEQFLETPFYGSRQMARWLRRQGWANHVWCADVTYIPLARGFLYLVAIQDWATRKVLSWRLSNTLDASFCEEALEDALERYGRPEIFNTDQGCRFTSLDFTEVLKDAGVKISMDGKGRWMDNVFIERLWRSLK